ncbi:MAG: hypothetical protein PHC99_05070 [Methylococcales bacterium]|nr:hypothetical protein [Methylococcales bacterium]
MFNVGFVLLNKYQLRLTGLMGGLLGFVANSPLKNNNKKIIPKGIDKEPESESSFAATTQNTIKKSAASIPARKQKSVTIANKTIIPSKEKINFNISNAMLDLEVKI